MSNLTTALAIVLSISAMLILGGLVASDIAGEDRSIISCEGTLYSNCSSTYILNTGNPQSALPQADVNTIAPSGSSSDSGIFAVIGAWIADTTGLSIVYNILSAPSTFLKSIGLPSTYADIIATIWYGLTLFLVISWWKGQDS